MMNRVKVSEGREEEKNVEIKRGEKIVRISNVFEYL